MSKPAVVEAPLFGAARLCALYPKTRMNERVVTSILSSAGVRTKGRNGYNLLEATDALLEHYKRQSEKRNVTREQDRDRQVRADADAAERRNMREAGELIPTSLAVALVEPIMVIIRQKISASSLTDSEKDDLFADLERSKELDWGKAAREAMG